MGNGYSAPFFRGETGEEENSGESSTLSEKEEAMKTADLQAKQYDYDALSPHSML